MRNRLAPALLISALVMAQDPQSIKVDVDLVNVFFTVRDKHSGLIGNLNKEDFTIAEDGKAQDIRFFTRENSLPLTIGLLIDVSPSQGNLISLEQNAASQFFTHVVRPKDLAFLISFGADAELLQDYTSSPSLLRKGLEGLKVNSSVGGLSPGPVPTVYNPRGTVLYDAVYLATAEQLKGQVGRKVIVLITDGEDQGSRYDIKQAIQAAQKADAIIYSIYYVDRAFYYGQSRGMMIGGVSDWALKRMADETGGRVFHIDNHHTLQNAFDEIQDDMRSQYALGYSPSNSTKDGSFRRIEIKTNNHDLKVLARKGYYAIKPE
jgi:VWFA-related protein